jgi:uncharacterized protein
MESAARWEGPDLILSLHLQPGAKKTEAAGLHGGALKLRLRARPIEGAANEALLEFLAELFEVPRRQVELVAGPQSREKRVRVRSPERTRAEQRLRDWAG